MNPEMLTLWAGIVLYTLAGSIAISGVVLRWRPDALVLALIVLGLALHGTAIGLRWERLGHGPFITMFEILSSNVWSLTALLALAYWRLPTVRPMAAVVHHRRRDRARTSIRIGDPSNSKASRNRFTRKRS